MAADCQKWTNILGDPGRTWPGSPNISVHFWIFGAKPTPPAAPPRDSLPGEPVKTRFGATRGPIRTKTMFLGWSGFGAAKGFQALGRLAWLALACLAFLASDRPRSPCLHLSNNSPAAFGGRAARSAAAVVAGAGKASEADPRRGKPSKPRPTMQATHVLRGRRCFLFSEQCMSWNR